jgi:uncharacterized membrane protein
MKRITKYTIIAMLVLLALACSALACSFFVTLPTNGIGYYTKPKEVSVVIVANVSEHITCNNGLLHLEFDLVNTDGALKNVELWVYFKDDAANGGNVLIEKYYLIGNMAAHQTIHKSIDVLFTPASQLDQLAHEDFSIHYTR